MLVSGINISKSVLYVYIIYNCVTVVSINSILLIHPSPNPIHLYFLDSTFHIYIISLVFFCMTYFTNITFFKSTHVAANGKIAFFSWLSNIPWYVNIQFVSVQSLSCVRLFVTPWATACQASLPITSSQSLHKLMSIESVMPSNHLILCHPLLLTPSILPSIRVFSNESVLHIRWSKYVLPFQKYHLVEII